MTADVSIELKAKRSIFCLSVQRSPAILIVVPGINSSRTNRHRGGPYDQIAATPAKEALTYSPAFHIAQGSRRSTPKPMQATNTVIARATPKLAFTMLA